MSSGHDNIIALNSQTLWLLAQDLHKVKPIKSPTWSEDKLISPHPYRGTTDRHKMDTRKVESIFFKNVSSGS